MATATTPSPAQAPRTLPLHEAPSLDFRKVAAQYDVLVWNPKRETYGASQTLSNLELESGQIHINNRLIQKPTFRRGLCSWSQKTDKEYTSGVINFTPDGKAFGGLVYLGPDESHAVAHRVAGAVPPTVFKSKVAKEGAKNAPKDGAVGASEDGPTVTFGYKLKPGRSLPSRVLEFDGVDATDFTTSMPIPKTQGLQIHVVDNEVNRHSADSSSPWPATGEIAITADGASFSGWMQKYDASGETVAPPYFPWTGKSEKRPRALRARRKAAAPLKLERVAQLSVAELMSIAPDDWQTTSFRMLVTNMKWALDDDQRTNFFGETKPPLSPERIDLVNKDLSFYRDKFAPAYLAWGFNSMEGKGAPAQKLTGEQERKLKQFLHEGLAKEEGYNRQCQGMALEAFIESSPRIKAYLKDGGEKWAKMMFEEITEPEQMNLIMNNIIVGSMDLANRYSTILNVLQRSGELARELQNRLLFKRIGTMPADAKLDDEEQINVWLPDFIQQYINQYIELPQNPTQEEQRWQEMAAELDKAQKAMGGVVKLAAAMTSFLIAANSKTWAERARNAAKVFAEKHTKLAKAGNFMFVAAWGVGLMQAISALRNWDDLKPEEKAATVASTVYMAGQSVLFVPGFLDALNMTLRGVMHLRAEVYRFFSNATFPVSWAREHDWFWKAGRFLRDLFGRATKSFNTEGTLLNKLFVNATKLVRVLGVLVSFVLAGIAAYVFAKSIMDKESVMSQAFNGVMMVSQLIVAVAGVVQIAVASLATAAMVVGAIFAVVGIVFAIVAMFVMPQQNEPPVDKYMREKAKPFVDGLPEAPPSWRAMATFA